MYCTEHSRQFSEQNQRPFMIIAPAPLRMVVVTCLTCVVRSPTISVRFHCVHLELASTQIIKCASSSPTIEDIGSLCLILGCIDV